MQLCYHNHDFEFVKLNGEYALDILYKEVPADILETEVDTCWVKVAGEDPGAYLRKYTGRAHIVHLKDFSGEKSEHMYALIGIDAVSYTHLDVYKRQILFVISCLPIKNVSGRFLPKKRGCAILTRVNGSGKDDLGETLVFCQG